MVQTMLITDAPVRYAHRVAFGGNRAWKYTVAYQAIAVEQETGDDPRVFYDCAFAFCSPKDTFCRATGRQKALEHLLGARKIAFSRRIGDHWQLSGTFLHELQKQPPVKQGLLRIPFKLGEHWDRERSEESNKKGEWVSEPVTLSIEAMAERDRKAAERKRKVGFSRVSRQLYVRYVKDKVDLKDKEAVRKAMHQVLISNGYGARLTWRKPT